MTEGAMIATEFVIPNDGDGYVCRRTERPVEVVTVATGIPCSTRAVVFREVLTGKHFVGSLNAFHVRYQKKEESADG